jgi:hypothetical protein
MHYTYGDEISFVKRHAETSEIIYARRAIFLNYQPHHPHLCSKLPCMIAVEGEGSVIETFEDSLLDGWQTVTSLEQQSVCRDCGKWFPLDMSLHKCPFCGNLLELAVHCGDTQKLISKLRYVARTYHLQYQEEVTMDHAAEKYSRLAVVKGYEELANILDAALARAQSGKGKERHADDNAFMDQPIMDIPRRLGGDPSPLLYQAVKKIYEGQRLSPEMARNERLDAIVYIAAAVLLSDGKTARVQSGGEQA